MRKKMRKDLASQSCEGKTMLEKSEVEEGFAVTKQLQEARNWRILCFSANSSLKNLFFSNRETNKVSLWSWWGRIMLPPK